MAPAHPAAQAVLLTHQDQSVAQTAGVLVTAAAGPAGLQRYLAGHARAARSWCMPQSPSECFAQYGHGFPEFTLSRHLSGWRVSSATASANSRASFRAFAAASTSASDRVPTHPGQA